MTVPIEDLPRLGYVEHDGRSNPFPGRGIIEVVLRSGRFTMCRFGFWEWREDSTHALDIVAYRPEPVRMEKAA
jgi:hypothetical protein